MMNTIISSTTPLYTLSTSSVLSGIPVHSIRQYIDKGLIIPFRKESNRNLFSQVDILRLKFIHKLLDEHGLNIAGIKSLFALIPCWTIRSCPARERKNCMAFFSDTYPCWEASEKGPFCKNTNCRECEVYRVVETYPDLKSFLRTIIP
ncbi:MAG: MerR family transcriptional regulator [Bacteroidales bacterium]|nr:MerR family transcriptional regulator [Bacteroidales bacterium]